MRGTPSADAYIAEVTEKEAILLLKATNLVVTLLILRRIYIPQLPARQQ